MCCHMAKIEFFKCRIGLNISKLFFLELRLEKVELIFILRGIFLNSKCPRTESVTFWLVCSRTLVRL